MAAQSIPLVAESWLPANRNGVALTGRIARWCWYMGSDRRVVGGAAGCRWPTGRLWAMGNTSWFQLVAIGPRAPTSKSIRWRLDVWVFGAGLQRVTLGAGAGPHCWSSLTRWPTTGPPATYTADDLRITGVLLLLTSWDLELIGLGWTCRDLVGGSRITRLGGVRRSRAVIFATGGMDSLPSVLPTALRPGSSAMYVRRCDGGSARRLRLGSTATVASGPCGVAAAPDR